ncbi:hypothetical protein M422DRAFT_47263 [Sphaerobolus stellatus SS14]|uniref:Peptidase A1 domain-containing protein n=1 Tax=Sphaerobolus stellatus (strain SS14) TaxID=990650 RepID=A0A0C9VZI0_SPHS4|nr:hypothetical protein M422DRAFT_47263 [Sphaerobolus stellatus SS14]
MTELRTLELENTDPSIEYIGQWATLTVDEHTENSWSGPIYSNMLKSTIGESGISFAFSGTGVTIFGTVMNNFVNNSGVITGPKVDCSIDSQDFRPGTPSTFHTNGFAFCEQKMGTLADGQHRISLNVVASLEQPFYFDRIEYTPSDNVSLSQATVKFTHIDPIINYGAGWIDTSYRKGGPNAVHLTNTVGSQITFPFTGKSVTWIGFYPDITQYLQNASTATYSVDDGNPTTFPLFSGNLNISGSVFNQIFFKTPDLVPGPHVLKVTYQGTTEQMPLALDHLFVENDTISAVPGGPSTTGTSLPATTSTSLPSSTASSRFVRHRDILIGGIVGGAMGGILILVACLSLWIWNRKRQRKRLASPELTSPFIVTFSGPPRVFRKSQGGQFERGALPESGTVPNLTSELQSGGTSSAMTRSSVSLVRHQDSGFRLPNELLPTYTEL